MAEDRIPIIIKEIQYWKDSKLLPDVQCDFLLALYTQGDGVTIDKYVLNKKRLDLSIVLQTLLSIILFILSFVVIYMIKMSFGLQIGIILSFLAISLWDYISLKRKQSTYSSIAIATFLIMMLMFTVFISKTLNLSQLVLQIIILMNFVGWFIFGKYTGLKYLKITSILGLLFMIIYIIL